MVANYYTLVHISRSLERVMEGAHLTEIFTQVKNQIILAFSPSKPEDDVSPEYGTLVVSCEPSQNFIYLRETYPRARRNSVDLLSNAADQVIRSVRLAAADRSVEIELNSGRHFVIQMYGSKANVLLVASDGTVEDAFLRPHELSGHSLPPAGTPARQAPDISARRRILSQQADSTLIVAAKMVFPQLGTTLIREALHRVRLDTQGSPSGLTEPEMDRFLHAVDRLIEELLSSPRPCIYTFEGSAPVFSLLPLQIFSEAQVESFSSIHRAIRVYVGSERQSHSFRQTHQAALKSLGQQIAKVERTLLKIDADIARFESPGRYEMMGKLLTAHMHFLAKGMKTATLENVLSESHESVVIPLDVSRTPAQNAEAFFQKAKQARMSVAEQLTRKEEIGRQRTFLRSLEEALEGISTSGELEQFLQTHEKELRRAGVHLQKESASAPEERIPFRVFTVSGGFQVWAGKSGANNDLLTTRHTKQNDLWFHTRGVGGSHVVLKTGTGKGEPDKRAIEEAAGIAAYYSKMKKASMVPVTMCLGKYVRKPKGAPPGTVVVEREKTIFAEPALPETSSADSGDGS
jgi:predicted ribosome quality control (RQC) complex YloA/Tae2 family protein